MSYFLLARSGPNTVDLRIVPVIVIPGIMGSRLRLSDTDAPTWDVDAIDEMRKWLFAQVTKMRGWLHHKQSSATLLTDGPYTTEQNARGWGSISSTYYRELLLHLEDEIDLGPGIRCPVYAFGYDWRKSNGDSAARLAQFTRATLDAEGAEEAIFVTHSMGGLVARAAIKRDAWLKGRTIGVIHLAQPACGAPVAYRRLYDGAGFLSDGWKVACLMGRDPADTFHLFSALPDALELLPYDQGKNDARGRPVGEWLMYRRTDVDGHTYTGWTGIATSIGAYQSPTYPPSIAPNLHLRDPPPKGLTREEQDMYVNARNEAKSLLKGASRFVTKLGASSSANTWSLASTGITTDTAVCFELGADGLPGGAKIDLDAGRTDDGDGTVPLWSALGLAAARGDEPLDEASDPETTFEFKGSGIPHDTFCDDADVRELVVRIIETMMMIPLHGAIESRGPELLERRMKALFGNRPAEMEIRVAKWFREARGAHVFFNDNPDTHRTADLTVDGHLVDVKLVESAEEIIRERVEDGLLQVAPSGWSDAIPISSLLERDPDTGLWSVRVVLDDGAALAGETVRVTPPRRRRAGTRAGRGGVDDARPRWGRNGSSTVRPNAGAQGERRRRGLRCIAELRLVPVRWQCRPPRTGARHPHRRVAPTEHRQDRPAKFEVRSRVERPRTAGPYPHHGKDEPILPLAHHRRPVSRGA